MLELVGRYRIQERIGEGAMADVYRAHDPSINRSLAIKILKGEYRQNKEYATRFLREAKAAGALSHPNIVTIYDVGEVDGYPYILMELLDGSPLNEVMTKEGAFAADQVMRIGAQLADALRYAHGLGVIHRDIKPSNIMLDKNGQIKILDFGIARMTEAEGLLEADHLKTQVGQVLGTPRYMSPEQALGQELDGRSDLFSVGVILYEMLTGKKAFAGVSAATLALQITQQDPEPLAKVAAESPRGLQFIINKLLAKRPERRFANGRDLADALRREQAVYDAVMAEGQRHRYLPLQIRLTLILGLIAAVVLGAAIAAAVVREESALEHMAITSGKAVTSFVASNAALSAAENSTLPAEQRDWLPVVAFVKVASDDPNVKQMSVVDADGVVRASNDATRVNRPYRAPTSEKKVASEKDGAVTEARVAGVDAFRFVKPITYAGRTVGAVDVVLSKAELNAASSMTRSVMILLGLLILALIVAATYSLTQLLSRPIRRLNSAFAETSKGNLNVRISHNRKDEFGELFEHFNRFTQHVQDRLDAVEQVALGSDTEADEARAAAPQPIITSAKGSGVAGEASPFEKPGQDKPPQTKPAEAKPQAAPPPVQKPAAESPRAPAAAPATAADAPAPAPAAKSPEPAAPKPQPQPQSASAPEPRPAAPTAAKPETPTPSGTSSLGSLGEDDPILGSPPPPIRDTPAAPAPDEDRTVIRRQED